MQRARARFVFAFTFVTYAVSGCNFEGEVISSSGGAGGTASATSVSVSGSVGGGGGTGGVASECLDRKKGPAPSDMPGDCVLRSCDGEGNLTIENDDADLPETDQRACTAERCVDGVASHDPIAPGGLPNAEEKGFCQGVCQGGAATGECGLQLYSRSFPEAGAWSNVPLSEVGWDGQGNAPPPRDIVAAEWMQDEAPRWMVWTQIGPGPAMFYERRGLNPWRAPVLVDASSTWKGLVGRAIASASAGNYGPDPQNPSGPDRRIVAVTTTAPNPLVCTYAVDALGDLARSPADQANVAMNCFPLTNVTNPSQNPAWAPSRATATLTWAATEQREACCGGNSMWSWIGSEGKVFQERQNPLVPNAPAPEGTGFVFVANPVLEAMSVFQFGIASTPAPNTTVAAYYDASAHRFGFVAP